MHSPLRKRACSTARYLKSTTPASLRWSKASGCPTAPGPAATSMTPAPASSQTTARAGCNSDPRIFTVPNAHHLHLLPGAGVCFGSAPASVRDSGCGSIPQPVTLHLHSLPGAGVCFGSAPAPVRDSGCGSIPQPVTLHLHPLPGAGVCLGSAPAPVRDSGCGSVPQPVANTCIHSPARACASVLHPRPCATVGAEAFRFPLSFSSLPECGFTPPRALFAL